MAVQERVIPMASRRERRRAAPTTRTREATASSAGSSRCRPPSQTRPPLDEPQRPDEKPTASLESCAQRGRPGIPEGAAAGGHQADAVNDGWVQVAETDAEVSGLAALLTDPALAVVVLPDRVMASVAGPPHLPPLPLSERPAPEATVSPLAKDIGCSPPCRSRSRRSASCRRPGNSRLSPTLQASADHFGIERPETLDRHCQDVIGCHLSRVRYARKTCSRHPRSTVAAGCRPVGDVAAMISFPSGG
jgi:hypothetical protein